MADDPEPPDLDDTVEMPAITDADEELMTRRQVAHKFRVTSSAVATWVRRGKLPEVRNDRGKPRYRRSEVEKLYQSGFPGESRHG